MNQSKVSMTGKKDLLKQIKIKAISTPDDAFFEKLADDIIQSESFKKHAPIIPIYRRPIFWFTSTAAAILLIIFIPFGADNQFNIREELDKIPNNDVKNYVQEHSDEFDEDIIFQALDYGSLESDKLIEELLFNTGEILPTSTVINLEHIQNHEIENFLNEEGYETEEQEVIFI